MKENFFEEGIKEWVKKDLMARNGNKANEERIGPFLISNTPCIYYISLEIVCEKPKPILERLKEKIFWLYKKFGSENEKE